MQEQLERTQRIQQESRERVRQIREQIQRTPWERGDRPRDELLNELIKCSIGEVLEGHRLVEETYPDPPQPHWESLRSKLRDVYLSTVADYVGQEFGKQSISAEFIDQLGEQMGEHNRPDWETTQAMEDIQEEVTGRRPNRS